MKPFLIVTLCVAFIGFGLLACNKHHDPPKKFDPYISSQLPIHFTQGRYAYDWMAFPDSVVVKVVDSCIVNLTYTGDTLMNIELANPELIPAKKNFEVPFILFQKDSSRAVYYMELMLDSNQHHLEYIGGNIIFYNDPGLLDVLQLNYYDHYYSGTERVSPSASVYIQAFKQE
jgi:hypothetical protein